MRHLIALVEGARSLAPSYDDYIADQGRYIYGLLDGRLPTPTEFADALDHLRRWTTKEALLRGMWVRPSWLDGLDPETVRLGVFWTTEPQIAVEFSGASSIYDPRFDPQQAPSRGERGVGIMMQIDPVPYEAMDLYPTVSALLASSEAEVRLKPDTPVRLRALTVNGRRVKHPSLGAEFLT